MTHFNGYEYTSARSAQVLPPKPVATAAPRLEALREVMATHNCTAAEAMHRLERKDKHRALLPSGGKAAAIPSSESFRSKVIAALSDEWQNYKAFVGISRGASKGNVMETLRILAREGRIDCRKISGHRGTEYRKIQGVAK